MKEIALIGSNGRVMSAVLSELLSRGLNINLFSLNPERVMLENDRLTVSRFDACNPESIRESMTGYDTVVVTNETNFEDSELYALILKCFDTTVKAIREAGVKRLIVVGAKESNAFYLGHLKRIDDIDCIYCDTEGDFSRTVADQIEKPSAHKANVSF